MLREGTDRGRKQNRSAFMQDFVGSVSCWDFVLYRVVISSTFFVQYSLSTKRSSPDDGNEVSPYSLSPVSNKR